jgi:hypothetical protein
MNGSFLRVCGSLTTVDSEPRIAGKLKAVLRGMLRFCRSRMRTGWRADRAALQAADTAGEDCSDLVEAVCGAREEGSWDRMGPSGGKLPTATFVTTVALPGGILVGGWRRRRGPQARNLDAAVMK